jgi:adenylate cyclase
MNKKLKTTIGWLLAPTAIGLYITFFMVTMCLLFYADRDAGIKDRLWVNWLLKLHQSSIDYRLQTRGPQKGSDQVALLVVDDKAVETVGRWPWPRETIAKAVDQAFKNGAKVLAFDIVFSEPSNNVAKQIYDSLHSENALSETFDKALQEQVQKLDGDSVLATSYAKNADKIVAGSQFLYENDNPREPGYLDFCYEMAFRKGPAAPIWDHEEVLISPQDSYRQNLPTKLSDLFVQLLQEREAAVREQFVGGNSKRDQFEINDRVENELESACTTILDDYKDEIESIWQSDIKAAENPKDFKFETYAAWLEDFKNRWPLPNAIPIAQKWTMSIPQIAKETKHTAFFNTDLDLDGTIRSKRLVVRSGQTYFPSLSLKAYLIANHQNAAIKIETNPATGRREISEFGVTDNDTGDMVFKIPTDGQGALMINYAGPQTMFPHMSLAELLNNSDDAEIIYRPSPGKAGKWPQQKMKVKKSEWLKDKILIVGATAVGIFDLRVTPFDKNYPGAETHANVVSNLLTRKFMRPWDGEPARMPLVLLAIGITLSVALAQLGAIGGLVLASFYLGGFALIDKLYLFDQGIVVTVIWPIILTVTIFIILTFYRYLTEERGKRELRQTFQKYVSPAIVEEILSDPKNIELGGRKTDLTVMFSDVRGFTTISEKLDPRALSDLLNSYLTPMTDIVFKNRGTLDKYMGDAIMAFFGAPLGYPDHAHHACRCALQSLEKLFELQKEYERKGLPTIDIGIGLNSGEVSVGNMGSETVRSYTVMGDAVNLASRLEGINKQYGTRIILSEFTYAKVKNDFICREVDWVKVKGKALPVKIFELIAEKKKTGSNDRMDEVIKWFDEGYLKYHEKAWGAALASFTKALNIKPDDEVSKVYLERCQEYLIEPPPDDWDGVFTMKTK